MKPAAERDSAPVSVKSAGFRSQPPLSAEVREQLILEHLPQVRLIARRIHQRLPESVSLDDLVSTGVVGLIAAIDRFDASHNVKLKTYAEYKIRGAILDGLRGLDWAPRQQRRRSKQIEAAILSAEHRLQRSPSEEEIAQEELEQKKVLVREKGRRQTLLSQLSTKLNAQRQEVGRIEQDQQRLSSLVDKLAQIIEQQKKAEAEAREKRRQEQLAKARAEREKRLAEQRALLRRLIKHLDVS